MNIRYRSIVILFAAGIMYITVTGCSSKSTDAVVNHAFELTLVDDYTLAGNDHLLSAAPAINPSGSVNVVVEIPAGTNAKWEVDKASGHLVWEFKKGKPRVVNYLAYPGNYGMIPRTLLAKETGGDGDPLDVIVLGPAVPRGSIVKAQVIGVLKLLDGGEQDDKLLAVLADSPFGEIKNLEQLDQKFPGVKEIIELWFTHYKGPGEMESEGWGRVEEAMAILDDAVKGYE